MGLKSGSRDAGLDGSNEESSLDESIEEASPPEQSTHEPGSERTSQPARSTSDPEPTTHESASSEPDTSDRERPTMESIPYKLRRDKVNEGREQVPFFLREHVIDAEDDLQNTLEELLGESVYKSDYREAAMIVAQRNPELIAEVLREWGYDLDQS